MALVVGLDIGTRTVKGAVFTGSRSKFQLADFFVEEVPELHGVPAADGNGDAGAAASLETASVEEVIRRALERRNLLGADVVAALDAKDSFIREITVPFTRDEQIRRTVPFEAENHFLSFDLDDVVLEWVKTGENDGKSRLILLALRNEVIEERLKLCKDAGCDPVALDLDGAALFNAFTQSPYYDAERSALIVDMGATSTKIVLVDRGRLKKIRSLRAGSTVLSPARMIPEPATVGAGVGGGGDGQDGVPPEEFSLEARFQEIEEALSRIEPIDEDDPDRPATPIAILADEDYERLRGVVEEEVEREFDRRFDDEDGGDAATKPETATATDTDTESDAETDPATRTGSGEDLDLDLDLDAGDDGGGGETAPPGGQAAFPGERQRAESDESAENYQDYLDRVATEIQRTLAAMVLDAPLDLICLTGGMSRPQAARYLGEELDVETVPLEFGDGLTTVLPPERMREVSAEGAVAIGLGLKGLGQDAVAVDFRKGRYRYEHRFERLKVPLLMAALLCLAFFLQLAFWAYHEYEYQSNRANGFVGEQRQAFKAFFGKEVPGTATPLGAAQEQKKVWEGRGAGDVGRFVSYTEALHDFAKTANGTGLDYDVQNMTFNFRVRRITQTGGARRGPTMRGEPSSVILTSPDSRAQLKFEEAFKTQSTVFDATTAVRPQSGAYRVDLRLELKPAAMAKLE